VCQITTNPYFEGTPSAHPTFRKNINHFNYDSGKITLNNLQPNTTLLIKVKLFAQTMAIIDTVEIRGSKPPIPWDNNYDDICVAMKRVAPYCCYFSDNPSGEFWKGMLRAAANIAPTILAAIPDPRVKAAAVAFEAIKPAVIQMLEEQPEHRTKRKAKNASNKYGEGFKKNKNQVIVPRKPKKHKTPNGNFQGPRGPLEYQSQYDPHYRPNGNETWEGTRRVSNNPPLKTPKPKTPVRPTRGRGGVS
jgi:hypothetical protein